MSEMIEETQNHNIFPPRSVLSTGFTYPDVEPQRGRVTSRFIRFYALVFNFCVVAGAFCREEPPM
jgi:hypothetical protein